MCVLGGSVYVCVCVGWVSYCVCLRACVCVWQVCYCVCVGGVRVWTRGQTGQAGEVVSPCGATWLGTSCSRVNETRGLLLVGDDRVWESGYRFIFFPRGVC